MTLRIRVTRDSVAAGDDADAPHERTFEFRDSPTPLAAVARIVAGGYLAQVAGGGATWSVVSGMPLAVVAQQWREPRQVAWQEPAWPQLEQAGGVYRLHFNYHAQVDPENVLRILQELKLRPGGT